MAPMPPKEIPSKWLLTLLNNLYEIEKKLGIHGDPGYAMRNVEKIKDALNDHKVFYEDPLGQPFKETRTDIEAIIAGRGTENLIVAEVIRPIIRMGPTEMSWIVQKGIVVVQSKDEEEVGK
jgi:hypothetical protein